MKYRIIARLAFGVVVISMCAGALPAQNGTDGGDLADVPSFQQDIWPTFVVKCNNDDCHGQKGSAFPKYTSYLMIKAKSKKIVKRLENPRDPMPPVDAEIPITDVEIERIRKWIEAGMPNN